MGLCCATCRRERFAAASPSPAWSGPSTRCWRAASRLSAQHMPNETARQAAAQLASGDVRLVLKPGMKISVQLVFTGPEEDGGYRQRYEDQLGQYLNDLGLVRAPGQPITLRLSAKVS